MKIRKAKGLESSVETTAMDKQRVAAMLSEHLRVKMQQAFTAKQTPHADVTIDATEKQRVAEVMIALRLRSALFCFVWLCVFSS